MGGTLGKNIPLKTGIFRSVIGVMLLALFILHLMGLDQPKKDFNPKSSFIMVYFYDIEL